MKNSEVISRVVNSIKALNKDEHISKRYVLSVLRSKARLLMLNNMHTQELLRNSDLFRTLTCFGLKREDVFRCPIVEFKTCKTLMKSKKRLPEMLGGKFGAFVVSVDSLDGEKQFLPTTLRMYKLNKDRVYAKYVDGYFYYIQDGYLYIPDVEVEAVNITIIGINEDEMEGLSECDTYGDCGSVYDAEFICPDKLIDLVVTEATSEIMSTWRRIVEDDNPNMARERR